MTSMNAPSTTNYLNMQNPYYQRLYLGAQANGLTAIADILVEITTKLESFCNSHISRGRILNFPTTESQYIQASTYIAPALNIQLDREPNNIMLHRFDPKYSDLSLRADVEPCWEDDPRTVLFILRSQGVPIATLNILAFVDRISYNIVTCKCPKPSWEVAVPATERWQLVSLYQLVRTRFKGMSIRRVDVNLTDARILSDGS